MKGIRRARVCFHTFFIDHFIAAETFTFVIFKITVFWAFLSYLWTDIISSLIPWSAGTKLSIVYLIVSTTWYCFIFMVCRQRINKLWWIVNILSSNQRTWATISIDFLISNSAYTFNPIEKCVSLIWAVLLLNRIWVEIPRIVSCSYISVNRSIWGIVLTRLI